MTICDLFNPSRRNVSQCALLFLLDKRQTILLVNGEALGLNGLIKWEIMWWFAELKLNQIFLNFEQEYTTRKIFHELTQNNF
jgi:hypothetical protein